MEKMISKEMLRKLVEQTNFLGVKEHIGHLDRINALENLLTFDKATFKGVAGFYTAILNTEYKIITVYSPRGDNFATSTLDGTVVEGDAGLENLLKLGF